MSGIIDHKESYYLLSFTYDGFVYRVMKGVEKIDDFEGYTLPDDWEKLNKDFEEKYNFDPTPSSCICWVADHRVDDLLTAYFRDKEGNRQWAHAYSWSDGSCYRFLKSSLGVGDIRQIIRERFNKLGFGLVEITDITNNVKNYSSCGKKLGEVL